MKTSDWWFWLFWCYGMFIGIVLAFTFALIGIPFLPFGISLIPLALTSLALGHFGEKQFEKLEKEKPKP